MHIWPKSPIHQLTCVEKHAHYLLTHTTILLNKKNSLNSGEMAPTLRDYFAIDKFIKFGQTIKRVGGWKAAIKQLYLMDDLKAGDFVGQDQFGNRYFEDNAEFMPRNRWVLFAEKKWLDYDASQVPPEWHRWLHHICDEPPTLKPLSKPKWQLEHRENMSIYREHKYVPYSTTRPKYLGWEPGQKKPTDDL